MRKPRTLGDRVLVRVKKDIIDEKYKYNSLSGYYEEVSESGLVIDKLSQDQLENLRLATVEAYVVQLGPDAYKMLGSGEKWIEVGQLITINRWSGVALPDIGDEEIYRLINGEDAMVEWVDEDVEVPDYIKQEKKS